MHPQEVAGMVLLDPAHEDQNRRYPQPIQEMFAPLTQAQIQQLRAVQEIIASQGAAAAPAQFPAPAGFPPEIAEQYLWLARRDPSRIETMISELEQLEVTQEQVRLTRLKTPWEFPLVVISHGVPQAVPGMPDEVNQAYEAAWQEMQVEIAGLSARGRRVVAEKSGHNIHHEQPDLVVEAIRQVVEEVRSGRR
jgi:pimeloyl-ACP methyl ester carboxylesterase